eukprot:1646473-Pleurochrysis_carterae.AAC.1
MAAVARAGAAAGDAEVVLRHGPRCGVVCEGHRGGGEVVLRDAGVVVRRRRCACGAGGGAARAGRFV